MKKRPILCLLVLGSLFACQSVENQKNKPASAFFTANPQPVTERPVKTLSIGAQAPDFNLPGIDGRFYSLNDFKQAQVLVVIFTCNHCPTAQAYEGRIKLVAADYRDKGVAVIAISPNSPLGLLYEELGYSDLGDDYADMQLRAKDQDFNFPYLYDGDTQETSLQYGPAATPHAFVFDRGRKLCYTGRLDKMEKPGAANAEDLRNAIDATLAGKPVAEPVTPTFGCSTKWGWKSDLKEKVNREWAEKAVTLTRLDAKGVESQMKNAESKKLRLINVWATWCGPCMLEYPEFIVIQRMFGARDFEFVSLSADKPEKQEKVLEFLKNKQSAVANYQFGSDDKYALINAVSKDWNGALPFTALIEPGGKIIWQHQGEVDFPVLKRLIVEHPMVGRYY